MKKIIEEQKIKIRIYSLLFLMLNYLFYYFRYSFRGNIINGLNYLFVNPLYLFNAFPFSLHTMDIGIPLLIVIMLFFFFEEKKLNKKKYRKGSEHGSAKWGSIKDDLSGMYNPDKDSDNMILSQNVRLIINDTKAIPPQKRRNKNVLVVGGSGSGKTRFFVKPNLMNKNVDYIVTDPKGTIVNELGKLLVSKKVGGVAYKLKIFNLVNFDESLRYNPFAYINNEQDILKIVDTIIKNTSGSGDTKEDFWVKAERLLYQAYISAILCFFPKEEQHLGTLMDLIELSETKEDDEDYKNVIDEMFEEIAKEYPDHFSLKQYRAYKLSAGKTAKSILISCGARLSPINIPAVRRLLSEDELQLDKFGNDTIFKNGKPVGYRANALFVIIPDTDTTFNFIIAIMYSQLFNLLCTVADTEHGGSMPRHIRFILDEFANIGEIPNFDKLIATIRSRNISATPILQSMAQLKSLYKDNADTIIGSCDSFVFLGGKEETTTKSLSQSLGKETIDDYNVSRTRSQSNSFSQSYSKFGRDLMTQDELLTMPRDECIVTISGLNPFKDKKYEITKHPHYQYHGEFNTSTWFDTSAYFKALRLKEIAKDNLFSGIENADNTYLEIAINTATSRYEIFKGTVNDIEKNKNQSRGRSQ